MAVTPGSPEGVGPELALRAARTCADELHAVLVGPDDLWEAGARVAGEDLSHFERIPLVESDRVHGGGAVAWSIAAAVRAVTEGQADAVCTAPIQKSSLLALGYSHPGHTEFLADLVASPPPLMVLAGPVLRVGLLTTHVALRDVPALLSVEGTVAAIRTAHRFLQGDLGIASPRLALAGLNPHAGEAGHFGDEEIRILAPAVARCRAEGLTVDGPLPADTVFVRALRGRFDMVLAPTHDQALVAVKVAHFGEVVNISAGLPIVRTSPDHGTAVDLHGTGKADPASMVLALRTAARMASNRRQEQS